MAEDTIKRTHATPARGVVFVLISFIILGASLTLTDVSAESIVRSLPVAIAMFGLFYKMAANCPITHRIPGPKTVLDHILFWPACVFFLIPENPYPWSYVGLAIAFVGISIYGVIRQLIEIRSKAGNI